MRKDRITEKRNSTTITLDLMSAEEILRTINNEDQKVIDAVNKEIPVISEVVELVTSKMKKGGNLYYVGAGTSGRLGVLDAVECTPTFGVSPDRIVGIIAGGKEAMFLAQENIEDDYGLGKEEAVKIEVGKDDCVIGIAASGDTPFVLGFVEEASNLGALTFGICCNHNTKLEEIVQKVIKPIVGPEVVTGSTRMKAGTAQKIILNMISTTIMIKLNKVYSNFMVDLKATNGKLRMRAKHIFQAITNTDENTAEKYLGLADQNVKISIVMYQERCSYQKAEELLAKENGNLRKVIG